MTPKRAKILNNIGRAGWPVNACLLPAGWAPAVRMVALLAIHIGSVRW